MKSYFELNKKILKAFGKDNLIGENYFEVEKCKDGNLTYEYKKNDKSIHINSIYNIQTEVNNLLKDINFEEDHLFVVYGIGLGYHIKELIKRATNESRIFIIETDEMILNTYIRNKNIMEFNDKRVVLLMGSEEEIISDFNSHIFSLSVMPLINNMSQITLPSYYVIYGEFLNRLNKRILDLFRYALTSLGNDVEDTIIGMQHNFNNIIDLIKSPSIELFKGKYKNKPVIIVGAGPSLDKNIEYLKEAEGKALIFATDAVISTLNKYNILPDAVFSIERRTKLYDAFYKNNFVDERIVFIGPPVVSDLIMKKLKNNKKLLCLKKGEKINEWINDSILNENRLIKMGMSCSHIAFGIAKYLEADPIVFIGQDLAFSKEGTTHSEYVEVKKNISINDKNEVLYEVDGVNGEKLLTNRAYKNFKTFLEAEIAGDQSNRVYIDATEGGAFKHGMVIASLKDVIKKYCNSTIDRLYDIIPDSNITVSDKINKAKNELARLINDFRSLNIEVTQQMNKINELMISENVDFKKIEKVLAKESIISNSIIRNDILLTFYQGLYIGYRWKVNKINDMKDNDSILEKAQIYKNYLENMNIAGEYCITEIDKILKKIEGDI